MKSQKCRDSISEIINRIRETTRGGTAVINLINNSFMAYLPLGHSALRSVLEQIFLILTKMATEEELNKVREDSFLLFLN